MTRFVNLRRPTIILDNALETLRLWMKQALDNIDRINDPVLPYLELQSTVDQTIGNNANTPVTWAVQTADPTKTLALTSNAAAPFSTRITTSVAGLYLFTGGATFAGNNTGTRTAQFTKNGAGERRSFNELGPVSSGGPDPAGLPVMALWNLAANDYVEMVVYQSSGGNLALLGTVDWRSRCQVRRLGQ